MYVCMYVHLYISISILTSPNGITPQANIVRDVNGLGLGPTYTCIYICTHTSMWIGLTLIWMGPTTLCGVEHARCVCVCVCLCLCVLTWDVLSRLGVNPSFATSTGWASAPCRHRYTYVPIFRCESCTLGVELTLSMSLCLLTWGLLCRQILFATSTAWASASARPTWLRGPNRDHTLFLFGALCILCITHTRHVVLPRQRSFATSIGWASAPRIHVYTYAHMLIIIYICIEPYTVCV